VGTIDIVRSSFADLQRLAKKYNGICEGKPGVSEGQINDVRRDFSTTPPTVWVKQRNDWVKAPQGPVEEGP